MPVRLPPRGFAACIPLAGLQRNKTTSLGVYFCSSSRLCSGLGTSAMRRETAGGLHRGRGVESSLRNDIEFRSVSKLYGTITAVADVDLSVPKGAFLAM